MEQNTLKNKYYLFVGVEAEGPDRGERTLFIPKNTCNRRQFLEKAEEYCITRLYFGAGNDRGINEDMFDLLPHIPTSYTIYLEITDNKQLEQLPSIFCARATIIFVCVQKVDILQPYIFKIETDTKVEWYELLDTERYENNLNDVLYTEDYKA